MKIYIAGPMTGHKDFNYPAFNKMAAYLRSHGHEVVNPAETKLPVGSEWAEYMKEAKAAIPGCDAIMLLDGWWYSEGATMEAQLADSLGLLRLRGWHPLPLCHQLLNPIPPELQSGIPGDSSTKETSK